MKTKEKALRKEGKAMEKKQVRNMIVLKNLPSNLVEEAYVILKENRKNNQIRRKAEKQTNKQKQNQKELEEILKSNSIISQVQDKQYILTEAQQVIQNCLEELDENKGSKKRQVLKWKNRYQRLRVGTSILAVGFTVCLILLFI